ncbi:hypothetical protein K438DRAFT_1983094 [Mycena galopus ATCC 62051]|nr:hypothetical protein K438DRAFT_1983094 [Mycena galopus ATCC 62051]
MGAEWTTEAEKEYLTTKLPAHKKAQEAGTLGTFWVDLQRGFFQRFPMEFRLKLRPLVPGAAPLLAEDEKRLGSETAEMKAHLKTWCSYHTRKAGRGSASGRRGWKGKGLFKLLKRQAARQPYREIEVYQNLYRDKIRNVVMGNGYGLLNEEVAAAAAAAGEDEQIELLSQDEVQAKELRKEEEALARIRANRSVRMGMLRKTAISLYAAETSEVVREVKAEVEQRNVDREGDDAAEGVRTPEQYQFAIDQVADVLQNVTEAIAIETGWHGFFVLGGPMPRREGQISMKKFCFGTTPEGTDFASAYPDLNSLKKHYISFLKRCFPHEVRDARSLEVQETPELATDGLIPLEPEDVDETPILAAPPAATKKPGRIRRKKPAAPLAAAPSLTAAAAAAPAIPSAVAPSLMASPPSSVTPAAANPATIITVGTLESVATGYNTPPSILPARNNVLEELTIPADFDRTMLMIEAQLDSEPSSAFSLNSGNDTWSDDDVFGPGAGSALNHLGHSKHPAFVGGGYRGAWQFTMAPLPCPMPRAMHRGAFAQNRKLGSFGGDLGALFRTSDDNGLAGGEMSMGPPLTFSISSIVTPTALPISHSLAPTPPLGSPTRYGYACAHSSSSSIGVAADDTGDLVQCRSDEWGNGGEGPRDAGR